MSSLTQSSAKQHDEPVLAYVYLGPSLPNYLRHSLRIARRNFPGIIYLLVDHTHSSSFDGVEVVNISPWYRNEPFEEFSSATSLDSLFRGGFWLKATERFYVLEQFMRMFEIQRLFHAEADVLVLNLEGYATELDKMGKGFFAPEQRPGRVIASLCYINSLAALERVVGFITSQSRQGNEMRILGNLFQSDLSGTFALPCESVIWPGAEGRFSEGELKRLNLVDAADFGHWLFGYDPRNLRSTSWNKYQEGKLKFPRPSPIIRMNPITGKMYLAFSGKKYLIRTLHIHAKTIFLLRSKWMIFFAVLLARLPFKIPLRVSPLGLVERVIKAALRTVPSRNGVELKLLKIVVSLLSLGPFRPVQWSPSNRERRILNGFIRGLAEPQEEGVSPLINIQSLEHSGGFPFGLETLLKKLPETNRQFSRSSVLLFLSALEAVQPAIYVNKVSEFGHLPMNGKTQVLLLKDHKDDLNSRFSLNYWKHRRPTRLWSFSEEAQLIFPDNVKKMFPDGISGVYAWAEAGLKNGIDRLSAFEAYGIWMVSNNYREVRLRTLQND